MQGFKIVGIIKVLLENILLELYFNIQSANEKISLKLCISNDGETILFYKNEKWIEKSDINYESYSVIQVNSDSDELYKLIGSEIESILYGVGKTLDTNKNVIYYIKIKTNNNNFLFFNNGDNGDFTFDEIENILENDIYGYEWTERLPAIDFS